MKPVFIVGLFFKSARKMTRPAIYAVDDVDDMKSYEEMLDAAREDMDQFEVSFLYRE